MDENSLFCFLEDDLRYEEPVRKKKRSSILKQTKYLGSEVCDITENENKRVSKTKRVSFANKFQVKEMNTGNIYDIPGQSEISKEYIPRQDIAVAEEDKENLVIPLRNKYPAAFSDGLSISSDFPLNQFSEDVESKEIKASDFHPRVVYASQKPEISSLECSPASDDMELTQMDKSIFPSPSPEKPSYVFQTHLPSEHVIYNSAARKQVLSGVPFRSETQESMACYQQIIPDTGSKRGVLSSSENNFKLEQSIQYVPPDDTLPNMDMTCTAAVQDVPEKALFSLEFQEKIISDCKHNASERENSGIFDNELEFTCMSCNGGLSKSRRSDFILSSSMLRSCDGDEIHERDTVMHDNLDENDYATEKKANVNVHQHVYSSHERDSLKRKLLMENTFENPSKDSQPFSCDGKSLYSLSRNPIDKQHTKDGLVLMDTDLKIRSSPSNCMDMTCVSPFLECKGEFENAEENSVPGTLLVNTQGADLEMTCTTIKYDEGLDDLYHGNIQDMIYNSSKRYLKKASPVNYAKEDNQSRINIPNSLEFLSAIKETKFPDSSKQKRNPCSSESLEMKKQIQIMDKSCMDLTLAVDEPSYVHNSSEHLENNCSENSVEKSEVYKTMEFTCSVSVNANIDESFNQEKYLHEKSEVINSPVKGRFLPQAMEPEAIRNYIFHDEDENSANKNLEAQQLERMPSNNNVSLKDSMCMEDSQLMQLTCATLNNDELEISTTDDLKSNEFKANIFEPHHPHQNLVPDTIEAHEFGEEKGKSLKRSCTTNDKNDADSSMVKRTKSHTPAIVYRMRRTKVTTEDIQKEIYVTPQLEKVMNSSNIFRSNQDPSIPSPVNFSCKKSNSVVEHSIITKKSESELFSSSILQSSNKAIQDFSDISFKPKQDYDQSNSSNLASATPKALSPTVFSANTMTAGESQVLDHGEIKTKSLVTQSFEALNVFRTESNSEDNWIKNTCNDEHHSKLVSGTPKAVSSEIKVSEKDILSVNEIQKPRFQKEIQEKNYLLLSSEPSSLSKEGSKFEGTQLEKGCHNNDDQEVSTHSKLESATSEAVLSEILSVREMSSHQEIKCNLVTSCPSKEESESESNQLKNVHGSLKSSKSICLKVNTEESSVSNPPECEKLSVSLQTQTSLNKLGRASPVHEVNESYQKKDCTASQVLTPKLSNFLDVKKAVLEQSTSKDFSLEKHKSHFHENLMSDDKSTGVSPSFGKLESFVNPLSKSSSKSGFKSSLDQEKDLFLSPSNNVTFKMKNDASFLNQTEGLHNLSNSISSYTKYVASFNQTGVTGECTMTEGCSLQLLPDSLLNDSISLCSSNVIKEKFNLEASSLPDYNALVKETKALCDSKTIKEESKDSVLSKKESGIESLSTINHKVGILQEKSLLKSPNKDSILRADVSCLDKPNTSEKIYEEMEKNAIDAINENIDKFSEHLKENKRFHHPSPVKEAVKTVEEINCNVSSIPQCNDTDKDKLSVITNLTVEEFNCSVPSIPQCNDMDKEMPSVDTNLTDSASSKIDTESAQNSLNVFKNKIEEASGLKKRWFLVSLHENRAVFQLNWKCYLFWCRLKIQINQISLKESKISFSYKSRGEEIEDFGYKCFLHFVSDKSIPFPVCSDMIIKKVIEYAELARKVESLMSDVMHLILFFDTTISDSFNPLRIQIEVLNNNLVSKFSLIYEVDFYSYPEKYNVPKVEHIVLNNVNAKVQEAIRKVQPGPLYLWKMASLAQNL